MEERIFDILFKEDEITWQSLLYDLVQQEGMDPFDIDVSIIAHKYIDKIKKLKETDLRLSGKVLLAAAILLKVKSTKLIEGLNDFNDFLAGKEEDVDISDEVQSVLDQVSGTYQGMKPLLPKTPQPRARKVSLHELMDALNQALEVKRRRVLEEIPEVKMEIPERKYDITLVIKEIYGRMKDLFKAEGKLTFSRLLPDGSKEAKVFTFVPLLHLSTQRKLDLLQETHFGEIEIKLIENKGAPNHG